MREAAQRAGTWTDVRPRALAVLAKQSARAHVEALVSDDDIDTAWAAATAGTGASAVTITARLASRRAATHPTDAIPTTAGSPRKRWPARTAAPIALPRAGSPAYATCIRGSGPRMRLRSI